MPDWTSKAGEYASTEDALQARARWVRRWLRARPETHIALVAHGDFLRYLTRGRNDHSPWANVEVREFAFATDEAEDAAGDAWLVPVRSVAVEGEDAPTPGDRSVL